MATRQKLKEEFLTCIICHEVFRDPVTLHCGHTFCAQCVTAYTKTQTQAIGKKSIPCSHCRGLTKVPDPTKPVEEWVGQFKTGFFVRGLVDAVVTDGKDDDSCTPCQEDGETTPALFWCSDCGHGLCSGCEKFHRKMPISKTHEVINLSGDNTNYVMKKRKRFTCTKHADSVIDMMCEDCDVAICQRCCILHHRKCESVITLEESLPKLKSVIEAHSKDLVTVVNDVEVELSAKKSQVKDVEKEADEAVTAIDVSGEKIIAEVRKQQENLKEKVKQAKKEALQNLKGDIKFGDMRLEEAKQRKGLIKEAMESSILINFYEMYKICKASVVDKIEDTTTNVHKKNMIHIKLEDNSWKIVSHMREMSLAALTVSGDNPSPIGTVSKPTRVKTIDTGLRDIFDILVMTVSGIKTIIVTSRGGFSVTSFYQRHGEQCQSQLKLSGSAYNVTKVSNDKCAVAIHSAKQIEMVCLRPDLKREKTIATTKQYLGLTCLNATTLAAGTEYPGGVDIIDMSGTVLRSFGSDIFTSSHHLTCRNDNTIIVSDCSLRSVTGISDAGVIRWKYPQSADKKIQKPWGVSQSTCGAIFFADENSHNVVQLTETGNFVRGVLSASDGLSSPRALFVDADNLMYVSVNHTTIHVYEFK